MNEGPTFTVFFEAAIWWSIFALGVGGQRWVFPHPDREIAWILMGGREAGGPESCETLTR